MSRRSTEVAIVGAGVCGLLVAKVLAEAGREVTLVERGALRSHHDQFATGRHVSSIPSAAPNHDSDPRARDYPWEYCYGVGGSTLAWAGVAPRFEPSDFEMRTRFGVGRDWPFGYDELEPYYVRAEALLAVAGPDGAQPPHPFAPVDELIGPYLQPYRPLPQSRPTLPVNGRPACSAVARCDMCPVDARYSGLHTFEDSGMAEAANVTLLDQTIVGRLRTQGRRVQSLECIRADGERFELTAGTTVMAAAGLENPGLLLRSGLEGPDVGRWLSDHEHKVIELSLDVPSRHGYGATPATGISHLYADDAHRAERGAVLVFPVNPGTQATVELLDGLLDGRSGVALRDSLRERFTRTLVLDTVGEDLPRSDRFVELSPVKDRYGLPLNRIHFPGDTEYLTSAYRFLEADLETRLAPLGARFERTIPRAGGAHLLGTCYAGEAEGVVDPNLRHHDIENLYVAGGSSFPTYSAAHPTLTIAALALRLGDHLASR